MREKGLLGALVLLALVLRGAWLGSPLLWIDEALTPDSSRYWDAGLYHPGGPQPLQVKQYRRVEGLIDHPPQAVVKTVTVKVTDSRGAVLASHSVQM